jgi:hypothetical protein
MLSNLWPSPERVSLDDGEALVVRPLTLRDLAALEAWALGRIRARGETPGALIDQALALQEDPDARDALLRRAYDLAESEDATLAGLVDAELASPEGYAAWLRLAVQDPPLDGAGSAALVDRITVADWSRLYRAATRPDPLDEAAAAIDRAIGVTFPRAPHPGAPTDETAKLALIVAERLGWTLDQIGDLTLGQWGAVLRCGDPSDHPIACPEIPTGVSLKAWDEAVALPRERFWAAAESKPFR